ncbi:MAG TPA: nucleotide sugar dehydrogenase [Polyangiaceae bacterium]|nr:nucleotide sugar dehydrogenase [Polyangiaceae bacterium]
MATERRVAIIGLGYVGLPVAVAMGKVLKGTIGFDISQRRIEELKQGKDSTLEVSPEELKGGQVQFTSDPNDLKQADFFIVAVPTPIDRFRRPDLTLVESASTTVGRAIRKGAIVVYESTVYPGVTEDVCGPILERESGLRCGVDFKLGYSPERINPGDKEHRVETIIKVVSGQDEDTLNVVAEVYGRVVKAGVHRAASIKVAEAAKVIENTQRDLNIALMNELAVIFNKLGIETRDVLAAARTKWNFLPFQPGLVGGHCIGVDPYYLTAKAEELGINPEVILAGRRLNDSMGRYVAENAVKHLIQADVSIKNAKVGVLGITFKENVPDIRNSKVPQIIEGLKEYGVSVLTCDPWASPAEVTHEYAIDLVDEKALTELDGLVLAVAHGGAREQVARVLAANPKLSVVVDVKSILQPGDVPSRCRLWRL